MAVTVLSTVVLLRSVLEHDHLLRVVVLQHRRLDARALHVRVTPVRRGPVVRSEHAFKRNLRTRFHTLQTVTLVETTLGHKLLRSANLDDGVPLGRRARGRGRVEADLVDGALRRRCAREMKTKRRDTVSREVIAMGIFPRSIIASFDRPLPPIVASFDRPSAAPSRQVLGFSRASPSSSSTYLPRARRASPRARREKLYPPYAPRSPSSSSAPSPSPRSPSSSPSSSSSSASSSSLARYRSNPRALRRRASKSRSEIFFRVDLRSATLAPTVDVEVCGRRARRRPRARGRTSRG